MIIAIDFDGTCVTHVYPEIGEDIGADRVLRDLVRNGHKLVLSTMRSHDKYDSLLKAINWFTVKGIPLHGIQTEPSQKGWTSSPKCYAELYIDDKGLGIPLKVDQNISERPFVDWEKVRKLLVEKGLLDF